MDSLTFNDALGVRWLNLAQHGRKEHKGRMIDERYALVLFPGKKQSSVHLWDMLTASSMASRPLPYVLRDLFCIDYHSAKTILDVFRDLAPGHFFALCEGEPKEDTRTTIYVPDLAESPSDSPADIGPDEAGVPSLCYADPVEALKVARARCPAAH